MRALCDMDTIQIEVTNACINSCSNCTRFCGHQTPYFVSLEWFRLAVDSMVGYPKMVGMMGGEPLLHPKFDELCAYMRSKLPKRQLGLWTCLPEGYEHHRDAICETFEHLFINDHSRGDIFHAPILVGAEEIYPDLREMYYVTDHCWVQNSWSASINLRGAFFCEIAASMSLLFNGPKGWPVAPGWWWRTPKDFREQIEYYCRRCGCALPLPRRPSTDQVDDISPKNYERLKDISKKIKAGRFVLSNLQLSQQPQQMGAYKDIRYRQRIAARYGLGLFVNPQGFCTPYLSTTQPPPEDLFDMFQQSLKEAEQCL